MRLSIRSSRRDGKPGYLVYGRDGNNDHVSIFCLLQADAVSVRDRIKAGASGVTVGRTNPEGWR